MVWEYSKIEVTVLRGYNVVYLRKRGVKERFICDAVIGRKTSNAQIFQTVKKAYMSDSEKKTATPGPVCRKTGNPG